MHKIIIKAKDGDREDEIDKDEALDLIFILLIISKVQK
jgi:hypothetical protein